MDAQALYRSGFHPVMPLRTPDFQSKAKAIPRLYSASPVKYYFIDFGISVRIPAGQPRSVLGIHGLDCDVPELSLEIPYDPFKVDIFIIGNLLKHGFYEVGFRLRLMTLAADARLLAILQCRFFTPADLIDDSTGSFCTP